MTTVGDIYAYMNTLAPLHMKMDWDNVGLQCGDVKEGVTKVLIALDPFEHVCREAIDTGAQLLITHHPLIFHPIRALVEEPGTNRCVRLLCRHGIAAIGAHTNLDRAPGGVNDVLAEALGLENIQVVNPVGVDENGQQWGLLHKGEVNEQSLESFLATVKKSLGCNYIRYVSGGKPVNKVCVGGGGCAGAVREAAAAGCDTFVAGDGTYNNFWDAIDLGVNLIDAGHFFTENPVCFYLAKKIGEKFPDVQVEISKTHTDPVKIY